MGNENYGRAMGVGVSKDTALAVCLMGGINIVAVMTYLIIDDETEEKDSTKYVYNIHIKKQIEPKHKLQPMDYQSIVIPFIPPLNTTERAEMYSQIKGHLYKDMHQIIPNLYLGNAIMAGHITNIKEDDDYNTAIYKQKQKLKSFGIKNIISCIHADNIYENDTEFTYLNIPFYDDNTNKEAFKLDSYLCSAMRFIKRSLDNNEGVLVHCQAGVSRSASIVIGYIMAEYKWTFLKSYLFVRDKRNIIEPNPSFKKCLIKYEELLKCGD